MADRGNNSSSHHHRHSGPHTPPPPVAPAGLEGPSTPPMRRSPPGTGSGGTSPTPKVNGAPSLNPSAIDFDGAAMRRSPRLNHAPSSTTAAAGGGGKMLPPAEPSSGGSGPSTAHALPAPVGIGMSPQQGSGWVVEEASSSGGTPAMDMTQHQQQQQQAAAEREFVYTRSLLPHVQRPALVAVLTSLLDDFPHLAPLIRFRCDKAMVAVVQQQQQQLYHPSPGGNAQGGGGASWGPPPAAGGDISPQGGAGGLTPPSQRKLSRSGRGARGSIGGDDEHQETCGIHGTLRPLKHLVFRPASGAYECIHGFHCLESSCPTSAVPSNSVTPKKDNTPQYYGGGGGARGGGVGGGAPPTATAQQLPPPPPAIHEADDVDVVKLRSLLQNVRDLGE